MLSVGRINLTSPVLREVEKLTNIWQFLPKLLRAFQMRIVLIAEVKIEKKLTIQLLSHLEKTNYHFFPVNFLPVARKKTILTQITTHPSY